MLHFPSFQIEETSLRMQRIPYGPVPDNFDMRNISAYAENTTSFLHVLVPFQKHLCACREYPLASLSLDLERGNISAHAENTSEQPVLNKEI